MAPIPIPAPGIIIALLMIAGAIPPCAGASHGVGTLAASGHSVFVAASNPFNDPPVRSTAVTLMVTGRVYRPYRTDLAPGTWVYIDADPEAPSPVRATQRALGRREVDYKSIAHDTLAFSLVRPTTNGTTVVYDYSSQASRTHTVGFWVDKNIPVVIGPDGNPYITDGHHTTAGYLETASPARPFIPGHHRIILGHIVANYFNPRRPRAPDDSWWEARAAENNAYLYGTNGNALTLPDEPAYANLQPILPSILTMPKSPSVTGSGAMASRAERSLAWGMVDGILKSAFDPSDAKIAGFKKTAPGDTVDINFVEFYWADFLQHRVLWNDSAAGSPLGSGRADANAIAAPLSFFAAVANGIALARSEVYRDQYGRRLSDYTNRTLFAANTVNWANGSLSNGLAAAGNTFNLFLRDDSAIAGDIEPSALSTNILRIDTAATLEVTNSITNITRLFINGGARIPTAWKDATVSNTTLTFPAGSGEVVLIGKASVRHSTVVSNGVFTVNGELTGGGTVTVARGILQGHGNIYGAVSVLTSATLAPGSAIGTLTIKGPLNVAGTTMMEIKKNGAALTNDLVSGIGTFTAGGILNVVASGDALAAGDRFRLIAAATYAGSFAAIRLPPLRAGLEWNTSRLTLDGSIEVK